jgi:nucleoside-diphosphate-sugar epimerase
MKILITGACGYVGTELTNQLIHRHKITALDTMWFGNFLNKHKNLKIIKSDVRNFDEKILKNVDVVVHLANIANDPSAEINKNLSWDVNVLGTLRLIELSIKHKVKKFIYASSGSVYGVSKKKNVTEETELLPISLYNKTKMVAEKILLNYQKNIKLFIVRPATVCGISKRMRFDTVVNDLTQQSFKNKLTVFGGSQIRPNLHIRDMINIYEFIIKNEIKPGIYNAGFENLSIIDIAKKIRKKTNCEIKVLKDKKDPRSYRQDSSKLLKAGYKQCFYVSDAIDEIYMALKNNKIKVEKINFTVKWMKKLGF